jgi:hypothetical protein
MVMSVVLITFFFFCVGEWQCSDIPKRGWEFLFNFLTGNKPLKYLKRIMWMPPGLHLNRTPPWFELLWDGDGQIFASRRNESEWYSLQVIECLQPLTMTQFLSFVCRMFFWIIIQCCTAIFELVAPHRHLLSAEICSSRKHSLTCDESRSDLVQLAKIWPLFRPQTWSNILSYLSFCLLVKPRLMAGEPVPGIPIYTSDIYLSRTGHI